MGNVIANLITDEALDDIFLVSAHDDAAHVRVIRLGKEIPWVRGMDPGSKGYQVVLLIAGHIVGMYNAPRGIDLTCAGVDEFSPSLMDSVPVSPKLFPLQPARVSRGGPYQLRAPLAVADVVLDVVLRDIRVGSARSHRAVRINLRRANAAGFTWRPVRQENADESHRSGEGHLYLHRVG